MEEEEQEKKAGWPDRPELEVLKLLSRGYLQCEDRAEAVYSGGNCEKKHITSILGKLCLKTGWRRCSCQPESAWGAGAGNKGEAAMRRGKKKRYVLPWQPWHCVLAGWGRFMPPDRPAESRIDLGNRAFHAAVSGKTEPEAGFWMQREKLWKNVAQC